MIILDLHLVWPPFNFILIFLATAIHFFWAFCLPEINLSSTRLYQKKLQSHLLLAALLQLYLIDPAKFTKYQTCIVSVAFYLLLHAIIALCVIIACVIVALSLHPRTVPIPPFPSISYLQANSPAFPVVHIASPFSAKVQCEVKCCKNRVCTIIPKVSNYPNICIIVKCTKHFNNKVPVCINTPTTYSKLIVEKYHVPPLCCCCCCCAPHCCSLMQLF